MNLEPTQAEKDEHNWDEFVKFAAAIEAEIEWEAWWLWCAGFHSAEKQHGII